MDYWPKSSKQPLKAVTQGLDVLLSSKNYRKQRVEVTLLPCPWLWEIPDKQPEKEAWQEMLELKTAFNVSSSKVLHALAANSLAPTHLREGHLLLVLQGWSPKQDLCQATKSEWLSCPVLEENATGKSAANQGKSVQCPTPSPTCQPFPSLFPWLICLMILYWAASPPQEEDTSSR